jgi:ribulose-5-phosphate 4-epimerase/fuculose-1-phosphate aldolase
MPDGNILSSGDLKPGPAGFNFHRAVLRLKDSVNATFHLHPMEGVAVAALEDGLMTVGRTVGEAFVYMERLIGACKLQTTLMATGGKIRELPEDLKRHTWEQMFARHGNQPMGGLDFKMYMRLAYKLDPGFAR